MVFGVGRAIGPVIARSTATRQCRCKNAPDGTHRIVTLGSQRRCRKTQDARRKTQDGHSMQRHFRWKAIRRSVTETANCHLKHCASISSLRGVQRRGNPVVASWKLFIAPVQSPQSFSPPGGQSPQEGPLRAPASRYTYQPALRRPALL